MIDYSRLHSLESEQSIIGALLIDPLAADRLGSLRPEHCYNESHRVILAEILRMVAAGKPVDVITVAEELSAHGHDEQTGGLAYLGELAANSAGSRNIGRYAETVTNKALERQLLGASETIRATVTGVGTTKEKLTAAQSGDPLTPARASPSTGTATANRGAQPDTRYSRPARFCPLQDGQRARSDFPAGILRITGDPSRQIRTTSSGHFQRIVASASQRQKSGFRA